jgi:hypothetical protein
LTASGEYYYNMGNSIMRDEDLMIYIETQRYFFNSGSPIEGTVFVTAKHNYRFDALLLRIEGTPS